MRISLPILFFVLLAGCAPSAAAVQTAIAETQAGSTEKQVAVQSEATAAPSTTPRPTNTPRPTDKPKPTNTAKPKNTPVPTTPPDPGPVTLTGQGDQIVDFENPFEYAVAHISHTGGSNFIVYNYDTDGTKIDLLVNEVGNYDGVLPLDFGVGEHTTRFEINAGGKWAIEISALSNLRSFDVPGIFEGKGDDVIALSASRLNPPDTATFKHSGKSNFIVYGMSGDGKDLLVNEVGKYEGEKVLERDTFLFIFKADGAWSVDVTTR